MLMRLKRWKQLRRVQYVRRNRDLYIGIRGKRGKYDDVMTTYRYWGKLWWIGVAV